MSDAELIAAYMAECFPSMREDSITDPEGRRVWLAKARTWYADKHAKPQG